MIVRSTYGSIVNTNLNMRGHKLSGLVRTPYGDIVDVSPDTTSPLAIAIYTAGGILLLGLGVYALNRKRK
jgi:hypothetical protein